VATMRGTVREVGRRMRDRKVGERVVSVIAKGRTPKGSLPAPRHLGHPGRAGHPSIDASRGLRHAH